ncbi:ACP S-malonyltransferase [Nocardiopsis halotolerans]|uniref:ACP S-malonyltransferase n=1 Tax=Nocardiopsis halotolerans TaxID=124252 RepID=UPI0023A92385|nr:ACP S-malonyltransferase [Nocardiopsis halotolerans]
MFPGQGSQRRGMGKGLFERFPDLVAQADECLGYSVEEVCLRDPDGVLARTEYTQPLLYVVNVLHHLDRISRDGVEPGFLAGHSLGEYCALFAAGGFDFVTGLRLVRKRGELMSRAPKGAMAAVVNLDQARTAEILEGLPHQGIDIANINSRRQCVLSGVYEELHSPEVRRAYTEAGASFVPLNVSAAFHSRCMAEVEEEFAEFVAGFEFGELTVPVVSNRTARPYPTTGYTDHLVEQISNPVRWYESISWLVDQGYGDFHEVGPGRVLSKLAASIVEEPLPVDKPLPVEESSRSRSARTVSAVSGTEDRTSLVFVYGGQGTQYHQMGRELYDEHPAFRSSMDRCSAAYQTLTGRSLVDAVYDDSRRGQDFDDVLYSHAALYCVGYSLTEALGEEGYHPDAVLGHSLGEYVAATVAGAMTFDDGLNLVVRQAELVRGVRGGGMLTVLAKPSLYDERPNLFAGTDLAAVNFEENFVVSGEARVLDEVRSALESDGVITVRLPVRQAFHSRYLDHLRDEGLALGAKIPVSEPRLPVYSSMKAGPLGPSELDGWDRYLWDVVRREVRFSELVASELGEPGSRFLVDLSASGSFANFFKHGHGGTHHCAPAINQFGGNLVSMRRLCGRLADATGAGR